MSEALILAKLAVIEAQQAQILALLSGGSQARGSHAPGASQAIAPASDRELDGQYGDPEIRFDPKRWTKGSFVGRRYSEATPEYLECLAEFKVWQAAKDDETNAVDSKGRPKSHWSRKDAALALGWAARLRARGTSYQSADDALAAIPGPVEDCPF